MILQNNSNTIDFIRTNFEDFNRIYFNNSLPMPQFQIHHTDNYVGYCGYNERNGRKYNFFIAFSDSFDLNECGFETTLLHEMIHLYIFANNIKDNGDHGREFMREAKRINSYGWEIDTLLNEGFAKVKNKHWWNIFS